jgi:hypothetical protein
MLPFSMKRACHVILAFCATVVTAPAYGASSMSDEEWIIFYREAAPTGFVITVDQAVTTGRVVPKHGNCFEIRFELRPAQIDNNGMPNEDAQAIIYGVEDKLEKLITPDEGRIIAKRMGQRMRSVWLCGSHTLAAGIQRLIEATRTIDVALRPSSLADVKALHPTAIEGHLTRDEAVFGKLAEEGDNNATPRKIDHFIYGVTAHNRKTIEARLEHLGFQLESSRPDAILFFRISPIELEALHRDTRALIKLCEELGCEYDGWGTQVQRTVN